MKQIKIDVLRRRSFARLVASLSVALVVAGLPAQNARSNEPDTAQKLLFDDPYLGSISPPAELGYRFEHSTADEKSYGKTFADEIKIYVDPPGEGHTLNNVTLDLFTDGRNRRIGPLSDVSGNPVIMVFLERDVFQMKRRVQGASALFRNTIRRAMRENAVVQDVDIRYGGETVAAKKVTISPFKDDRIPQQFAEFRNKIYHFTVSQAVPGGFFEIVSLLPDPENQNEALVVDRMTFTGKSDK